MSKSLDAIFNRLNLTGRDSLYTHLIQQEIPFWLSRIYNHGRIADTEVDAIAARRGFNAVEKRRFQRLADALNTNAKYILAAQPPESKHHEFMQGYEDGARGHVCEAQRNGCPYQQGHRAGKADRDNISRIYAMAVGHVLPAMLSMSVGDASKCIKKYKKAQSRKK